MLICVNGAYGKRMIKMLEVLSIPFDVVVVPENRPVTKEDVDGYLKKENKKGEKYW